MTLEGRREVSSLESVSEQFHQLWEPTLSLDADFHPQKELARQRHSTSGTCFYFNVAPKSVVPDVKAYIPVKHYAPSDTRIMRGLVQFLEGQGSGSYAQGYMRVVEGMATNQSPGDKWRANIHLVRLSAG